MMAAEIRKYVAGFVAACKDQHPDEQTSFLVEQSKVCALYEIAAQLAELNEQLSGVIDHRGVNGHEVRLSGG